MGTGKKEILSDAARAAVLREAPMILEALARVRAGLDASSEPCSACGLHVSRRYRDAQLAALVDGVRNKLGKWLAEARFQQSVV
jgi:hypothetical protein